MVVHLTPFAYNSLFRLCIPACLTILAVFWKYGGRLVVYNINSVRLATIILSLAALPT